jgi:1,5-anhydro-D-fructose reductase (1,5-anhydro-D-mannitol-forming)
MVEYGNMNESITPDSSKEIRWGIIGCGDVTEVKSGPAYQQTDGFALVAVMRRDAGKAADYARRHGVPKFYSDADKLIADPDVDAIYIATPPDRHMHYAMKVVAAGKPCCIEKPMAASYQDCLSITTAFAKKNIPLFSAYYRRSLPRFRQIKEWLSEQAIGEVRQVSWHLCAPPSAIDLAKEYNWRTDADIATGGYFDDLASHGLDLIAYFLGDFKEVSGTARNQQGLYSAKDAIVASWVHEDGIPGTGSWNFGCHVKQDRLTIYGSEGLIECAVFQDEPLRLFTLHGQREIMIEHPIPVQLPHVQAIADDLSGRGKHSSTGRSATHTAWVMDKILGRI